MFCKNCGQELTADIKFCPNCGTKTDTIEPVAEPTYSTDPVPEAEITDVDPTLTHEQIVTETIDPKSEKLKNIMDKVFLGGFISAAFGAILFIGIVLVSLIGWGEVYLFGGYDFTKVLAIISMIFMLIGAVILPTGLILNTKNNFIKTLNKKLHTILAIILIVAGIGFSVWGIIDCCDNQNDYSDSSGGSYGGSYGGASGGSYNSALPKTSGLSLKVDSIKTSGSYTYVYCTVKNVSANYGVATRYRYVKVKGQFKNYSGQIVDTDWTYAVDSAWIEPGESKTFYFMVQNTNIKSATLSFID